MRLHKSTTQRRGNRPTKQTRNRNGLKTDIIPIGDTGNIQDIKDIGDITDVGYIRQIKDIRDITDIRI